MKVILSDFVQNLGSQGDEVDVAPGYARNYLIPQKLAFVASAANRKTYENNLKQRARKIVKIITEAEEQKARIEALEPLEFTRKTGEEGKLFGSVTSADIGKALDEHGFKIDKKRIDLAQPIKKLGEVEVEVKIHAKVTGTIKLIVKGEAVEPVPDEADEEAAEDENAAEDNPAAEGEEEPQEI